MKRLILLPAVAALAAIAILVPTAMSAPTAQTIRVTEVSYKIKLSAAPKAGQVRFVVRNASGDDHDFWVNGGGKTFRTRVLGEGGTASVTATLKKGVKYRYWCAVDDHAAEGMRGSFVAR